MFEKVCVIGLWHLGSVVSGCLADLGYTVVGFDHDLDNVQRLNKGVPPLFEPGLEEVLTRNIEAKRLGFTSDLGQAVKGAGYILITFDAPVSEQDEVDLSEILDTAVELSRCLENNAIVIVSSQVPVGTCERIKSLIREHNPSLRFDIACSPENLRLGQAIEVFKNPERIVIGADNSSTLDRAEELFRVFNAPILRMNLRTAEMTKHALNAFLATSISFANEMANICDEVSADAMKIAEALRTDSRIGQKAMLLPGLAFSGGTLPRDLKVLINLGKEYSFETPLLNGVWQVNQRQNGVVVKKLENIFGTVNHLNVGILGLTYKAGTSTLRRSAALDIIRELTDKGASVKAYDPKASVEEVRQHHEFEFCADSYEVARGTDALVIVTEWPEFLNLDYGLIKSLMKNPVLIDTKNMLDDGLMLKTGFQYLGIGRGLK